MTYCILFVCSYCKRNAYTHENTPLLNFSGCSFELGILNCMYVVCKSCSDTDTRANLPTMVALTHGLFNQWKNIYPTGESIYILCRPKSDMETFIMVPIENKELKKVNIPTVDVKKLPSTDLCFNDIKCISQGTIGETPINFF